MTAHPIDTEALRRLADAATPGPWTVDDGGGYDFSVTQGPDGDYLACDVIQPDAEFIAAARTAVPALLDALDAANDTAFRERAEMVRQKDRAETAEHRATRAEAQSAIRGRAVVIYRGRADEAEFERDWNRRSSRQSKKGRIEANARAERAEARIKAVRELHVYENRPVEKWARGHRFTGEHCAHDGEQWPCRTIRALDGDA